MSDYIKREDAIERINHALSRVFVDKEVGQEIIASIPPADVAPVRHGRWVVIDAEEPRRYGCSECKMLSWHMENYCGNCGARMDGDDNEID